MKTRMSVCTVLSSELELLSYCRHSIDASSSESCPVPVRIYPSSSLEARKRYPPYTRDRSDEMGKRNIHSADQELTNYGSLQEEGGDAENPLNDARTGQLLSAKRRLIFALSLCLLVMTAEIVGGILSGSLAILADAAHLLTDVITYIISLTSIWLAQRPSSKKFTFGLVRAEVLGAMYSIMLSVSLAVALSYFAIMRIVKQHFEINGTVMLIISAINFGANLIQICQLQFGFCCLEKSTTTGDDKVPLHHGHGHGHGLSHGHSHGFGTSDPNDHMNVRAACLHILGDSLFGFGLLVGAIIIYFKPELQIIDPILTIIFGVIVLLTLLGLLRETINILMAGKPREVDFDDVRRRLVEIDGVEGVHSLRIWSLTSDVHQITAHLVLARLYDGQPVDSPKILREARHILETKFAVVHTTIQTETVDEETDFACARKTDPK